MMSSHTDNVIIDSDSIKGSDDEPEAVERHKAMERIALDAPAWVTESMSSQSAQIPFGGSLKSSVYQTHHLYQLHSPLLMSNEGERS